MKNIILFLLSLLIISCSVRNHLHTDTDNKAALIPMPAKIHYKSGKINLKKFNSIAWSHPSLKSLGVLFINQMSEYGLNLQPSPSFQNGILLKISTKFSEKEKYQILATDNRVTVEASDAHGIFNGLQTLKQLIKEDFSIANCYIEDAPEFAIRGYMIDVGRNYQSIPLIKQQIDVMAAYKLNVLHFHVTEDIAWRFEIPGFPELTAPENMLRDKGKFYTVRELRDIQNYCRERFITLIPEIDMPGHSAAFERAMKVNMQTNVGIEKLKKIISVFIETYKPEYLHIGGDEVKITNQQFLPEMLGFIHSKGIKTIGWAPGGNIGHETIRQLWMNDNGHKEKNNDQFIDSKHLYINHMDPLETVTTIFYRKIGDVDKGNDKILGAIICNWPDRKVEREDDVIRKSATYPAMLALAERSWRGGGYSVWIANIGSPDQPRTADFKAFEDRLMFHKKRYFKNMSFPYMRQQDIVWNLYGPYENNGELTKSFEPENIQKRGSIQPYKKEIGGTIILRHWWHPLIEGALDDAKENTTWYASTKVWSDKNQIKNFWIGFYNLSRSPNTDSPPVGQWDNRQSRIWVNNNIIPPPQWVHGGLKGHSEIPLMDEGYEYRAPTPVQLKKGWNDFLIKAPVGSFKGKDWKNPVKWMFTCIQVD